MKKSDSEYQAAKEKVRYLVDQGWSPKQIGAMGDTGLKKGAIAGLVHRYQEEKRLAAGLPKVHRRKNDTVWKPETKSALAVTHQKRPGFNEARVESARLRETKTDLSADSAESSSGHYVPHTSTTRFGPSTRLSSLEMRRRGYDNLVMSHMPDPDTKNGGLSQKDIEFIDRMMYR